MIPPLSPVPPPLAAAPERDGSERVRPERVGPEQIGPEPASALRRLEAQALAARDRAVRARSAVQAAAGAPHAAVTVADLRPGPDGRLYADGARLTADLSPASGGPRATVAKLRAVLAAATAAPPMTVDEARLAADAAARLAKALAAIAAADESAPIRRV